MVANNLGRGHKAPYSTTHVRIPEPLKPKVERMSNSFKISMLEKKLTEEEALQECNIHCFTEEEILEAVRYALRRKQNAKVTVQSLLTALFGKGTLPDITLDI